MWTGSELGAERIGGKCGRCSGVSSPVVPVPPVPPVALHPFSGESVLRCSGSSNTHHGTLSMHESLEISSVHSTALPVFQCPGLFLREALADNVRAKK